VSVIGAIYPGSYLPIIMAGIKMMKFGRDVTIEALFT
jgi:hypothetical protein